MKRIILLLISAFVLACSVMTIVGGKETDNFIKYAEFNVTADALQKAVSYDVSSQSEDTKLNYIEILSYLGANTAEILQNTSKAIWITSAKS